MIFGLVLRNPEYFDPFIGHSTRFLYVSSARHHQDGEEGDIVLAVRVVRVIASTDSVDAPRFQLFF